MEVVPQAAKPVAWGEVADQAGVNASVRRKIDGLRPYFHQAPDGMLEVMTVKDGVRFVPYIPARPFPGNWTRMDEDDPTVLAGGYTWRHWALWKCHNVFLEGHKPLEKTKNLLGRTGWWPRQGEDLYAWCDRCSACAAPCSCCGTVMTSFTRGPSLRPWRTSSTARCGGRACSAGSSVW